MALTSSIDFQELLRTGDIITNAICVPSTVYGVVLIYFALCFPLTVFARRVERRLAWR